MKPFTIIAAVSSNGVIGAGGQIPWHLPADLKHFKETTAGHGIVMGRKTFASIGRALPKRKNVVLTHNAVLHAELFEKHELWTHRTLHEAIDEAARGGELGELTGVKETSLRQVFVIGGGDVYALALPLADQMIITHVHGTIIGAAGSLTFFPPVNWSEWRCVSATTTSSVPLLKGGAEESAERSQPSFTIATYKRISYPVGES